MIEAIKGSPLVIEAMKCHFISCDLILHFSSSLLVPLIYINVFFGGISSRWGGGIFSSQRFAPTNDFLWKSYASFLVSSLNIFLCIPFKLPILD